jgi:hypothetical protein
MATFDHLSTDARLTEAAADARAFSAGLSRTLARRGTAKPHHFPVPFARDGGIASPVSFPLTRGGGLPSAASDPVTAAVEDRTQPGIAGGRANPSSTIRSPTQLATMLARLIAQGQRNL